MPRTARPVNRVARRHPLPCRCASRWPHDAPLPPRRRGSEWPARPGGHGAPAGRWRAPEGRQDAAAPLPAGAASEGGRRDAARARRQGGRGVGMGTHRVGSIPAHARDGTPKRAVASHARPALPAPSLMARCGGPPPGTKPVDPRDSGTMRRSIPPPIKTWLGKCAGGGRMAVRCSTARRVWPAPDHSPTPALGCGMPDWCHPTGAGAERTLAGPSKGGGGILRWQSA